MKGMTCVNKIFRVLIILILLSLYCVVDVKPVSAISIIVNTTNDEEVDDGNCSLREAIIAAKTHADYYGCVGGASAYISLPAGTYIVNDQMTSINTTITINGESSAATIIQGSSCNPIADSCTNDHQFIWVSGSGTLTLSNLTLRYWKNTGDLNGGVIYNAGILNISNSIMTHNRGMLGGAIANNGGTLSVINSTISQNMAKNTDFWDAGAIYNSTTGSLIIEKSTFSGNSGRFGGAIQSYGNLEIINSTFSGNSATIRGGGIYNDAILTITNSTFSENVSSFGGAGLESAEDSELYLTNTIIANSIFGAGGGDCNNSGLMNINLANYIEDGSCDADFSGDPSLGPLSNNGGPTETHALLEGSPAVDIGDLDACPDTDQRGITRPQGEGCDIGAYEREVFDAIFLPLILR